MRLALAMGRTVRELEETLGADEWDDWLTFSSQCDLPDGFLVAGVLGSLVSHVAGGKGKAGDFAPYYRQFAPRRGNGLAATFALFKSLAPNAPRAEPAP